MVLHNERTFRKGVVSREEKWLKARVLKTIECSKCSICSVSCFAYFPHFFLTNSDCTVVPVAPPVLHLYPTPSLTRLARKMWTMWSAAAVEVLKAYSRLRTDDFLAPLYC